MKALLIKIPENVEVEIFEETSWKTYHEKPLKYVRLMGEGDYFPWEVLKGEDIVILSLERLLEIFKKHGHLF